MNDDHNHATKKIKLSESSHLLPVTLLGGFLGSGKTTLLKHILERKNEEDGKSFKCAVIVNDVAELNIDKALIDQSSFLQSGDDIIAMQNGCVCCTLSNDLVKQVIEMAESREFDYMIIEASGIAEPSEIAKLFAPCEEDHDHEAVHGGGGDWATPVKLYDVARLDTCVTLVDAADFFSKLETIEKRRGQETYAKLLVEQIEYANVVVVNKTDLVTSQQVERIVDIVALLNSHARILTATRSSIPVDDVVGTRLYDHEVFESLLSEVVELDVIKECCKDAEKRGESPCCRKARTIKSDLSEVMLSSKKLPQTRHEARFGITSFIYRARRPFHSGRFHADFINKYFMFTADEEEEDDEEEEEEEVMQEEEGKEEEKKDDDDDMEDVTGEENDATTEDNNEVISPEELLQQHQNEANARGEIRAKDFGSVLRSKGFIWTTHAHDIMIEYGQAGNAVSMCIDQRWKVLDERAWVGSDKDKMLFRKDFIDTWGDRRQELVFIGQDMKYEAIQKALDDCLLDDDEFAMGVDGWKATIGDMFLGTA